MITALGLMAGILTTISFVPQVVQCAKTHNTAGISLPMYIIFVIGIFLWLVYGLLINQPPVWLANSVTLILAFSILIMKIRYG